MDKQNVESTVDIMLKRAEEKKKLVSLTDEEMLELKKACNYVFSSKEGKLIAKHMMKACQIYKFPGFNLDYGTMCFEKGLQWMYKFFVLGLVDQSIVNDIEMEKGE